jgi:hypothetical protein
VSWPGRLTGVHQLVKTFSFCRYLSLDKITKEFLSIIKSTFKFLINKGNNLLNNYQINEIKKAQAT